jgi:hypothetical protein
VLEKIDMVTMDIMVVMGIMVVMDGTVAMVAGTMALDAIL